MINFGEVLSRAWHIIWRNKILWLFGLFASLGGGGGGGGGSSSGNVNFSNNGPQGNFQEIPNQFQRILENWGWLIIVGVILLFLLLMVVFIVLNTFGKIGLARGAWNADESDTKLTFGALWQTGRTYFWRVLLLILLIWALSATLALVVIIPTVGLSILTLGIGLICLIPLICVLVIALWALSVLADLAVISIVNEDLGVIDSVKRAWAVFTSRPADFVVMALILWIAALIAGFIVGIPMLIILAPALTSLLFQSRAAFTGGIIISVVLGLLYLPVLLLANAIIQSYVSTAWTLVFRRVTGRNGNSGSPQVVNVNPAEV